MAGPAIRAGRGGRRRRHRPEGPQRHRHPRFRWRHQPDRDRRHRTHRLDGLDPRRIGFAADRALFYVTGGAAVADIGGASATLVNGPAIGLPAGTFTSTAGGASTRWGWTVGGGIEWAFNQNWSLAGEYRHTDFGSRATTVNIPDGLGGTFAPVTVNGRLTVDQATARLNYRFGGPIVARH